MKSIKSSAQDSCSQGLVKVHFSQGISVTFRGRRIFGKIVVMFVGMLLFVGGAIFGEVAASLFVAGTIFSELGEVAVMLECYLSWQALCFVKLECRRLSWQVQYLLTWDYLFGDMGFPFETYSGPTWLVFQTKCAPEAGKVTTANGRVGD